MKQTISQMKALAHHAGLTFAEFVRGRKKERAFDAVTRDGVTVTFRPRTYCSPDLVGHRTIFKSETS